MKKILTLILVCLLPVTALSEAAVVEGSVFAGRADDHIAVDVNFDPQWITEGDNTLYNPQLAALSALLCTDVYCRDKDLDKGTASRVVFGGEEAYTRTAMMERLGFEQVRLVDTDREAMYETDVNENVNMILAHTVSGAYDLYVAAVRGAYAVSDWKSSVRLGTSEDSDIYGMSVAAGRAMEYLRAFMAENDNPALEDRILICGHSRGGAIGELLGKAFEDEGAKSFTYCFNTPPLTVNSAAAEYKTIFNISDSADFFADFFPFGEEKLTRYGTDLMLRLGGNEQALAELAALKGRTDYLCMTDEQKAEYGRLFSLRFADRDALFAETTVTRTLENEDAVQQIIGAHDALLLGDEYRIEKTRETENGVEVTMVYNGSAVMNAMITILMYGEQMHDAAESLFSGDETACAIMDFLCENAAAIGGGHKLINSYVLTQYVGTD